MMSNIEYNTKSKVAKNKSFKKTGLESLTEDEKKKFMENLSNKEWRLFSGELYKIINKDGELMPFIPNKIQRIFYENMHYKNIILKARQQGLTTLIAIMIMDFVLFGNGKSGGIIAHTLDDAKAIFSKKIKFVYDNLPDYLKILMKASKDSVGELTFSNNDGAIYVDTSFRGASLQFLHVSEYGKVCATNYEKAKEIKTGALNAIGKNGIVIIESTAEGSSGEFYNMCYSAMDRMKSDKPLTKLDYRFFFFPWFINDEYSLTEEESEGIELSKATIEYFDTLKGDLYLNKVYPNTEFSKGQMMWYQLKRQEQGDSMFQEYPSTPDEAFNVVIEGSYYEKECSLVVEEGRLGYTDYNKKYPVNTVWDIGISDDMSIWFYQVYDGKIFVIDYFEGSGWSMIDICKTILAKKRYNYGRHYLPHDAEVRNVVNGKARIDEIEEYLTDVEVLPKLPIADGINQVRNILPICHFYKPNCEDGFTHLKSYSREKDKRTGIFKFSPKHDEHSHGSDSFRYLATAYDIEVKPGNVVYQRTGLNKEYGLFEKDNSKLAILRGEYIKPGSGMFSCPD